MSEVFTQEMVEAFWLDELVNYEEGRNERRAQQAAEGNPMDEELLDSLLSSLADITVELVEQGYNGPKRKAMGRIKPFPIDEEGFGVNKIVWPSWLTDKVKQPTPVSRPTRRPSFYPDPDE